MTTLNAVGEVTRSYPTVIPTGGDSETNGTVRYLGATSATRPPSGKCDRHEVALAELKTVVSTLVQAAQREPTEVYIEVIQLVLCGVTQIRMSSCNPTRCFTRSIDDQITRGYLTALRADLSHCPPDTADRVMLPARRGGTDLPSVDARQDLTTVQTLIGILCGPDGDLRTTLVAELAAATLASPRDNCTATRMLDRLHTHSAYRSTGQRHQTPTPT